MVKQLQELVGRGKISLDKFDRKHLILMVVFSTGLALFLTVISHTVMSSEPDVRVNINENSISPSRPVISSGGSVKFVNSGATRVQIDFERGPESFSLSPNASEVKNPEITTYYTVEREESTLRGSIAVEEE